MLKFDIKNLNLHYGSFHALKDVSLGVEPNAITALIGPSGCGKSTLLKTLNRMNDLIEGIKIEGSIKLDGEEIYGGMDVNLLRKRVGMVFQKPNPFPMSVYDNIAFGPRTHGIHARARLNDIVEKSLRGAAIWDEVKDLKKDLTIVIVTHNMQQAVRISDRTAFFLLGEAVEVGDTQTVFSTPRDKRTEDYITGRFG